MDTVENMALWETEALRGMIMEFVAKSGFECIPLLPKEATFTVLFARKLPKILMD